MIIHEAASATLQTDGGHLRAVFEQAFPGIVRTVWTLP
jgi:hypothetical protein